MWPFKKEARASLLPPPHASAGMSDADFKQAQDNYVTKFDKLVKPSQAIAVESARASAEFGKMIITYMVLGNVGGLAALVLLAPMMPDRAWLAHQFWPAFAFACGAALGVGLAVAAHFNYASHTHYYFDQGQRDAAWLKGIEFKLDASWRSETDKWFGGQQDKASRRADISNTAAGLAFLASAVCWIYGAVSLATSVMTAGLK